MQIFKTRIFHQWSEKIGLDNESLKLAVDEMLSGLYEAGLGGHLFKKRIRIGVKGKSNGVRTIIAFKKNDRAFFVYGYAKNKKTNITDVERRIYKELAMLLFSYNIKEFNFAIENKELIEVL
jgi:hypothetical protein